MDETKFFLRVSNQRGEFTRRLQPEVRPKQLQAVEKLDGFGVGHFVNDTDLMTIQRLVFASSWPMRKLQFEFCDTSDNLLRVANNPVILFESCPEKPNHIRHNPRRDGCN